MEKSRLQHLAGMNESLGTEDRMSALLREIRELGDWFENAYEHDVTPDSVGRAFKQLYEKYSRA